MGSDLRFGNADAVVKMVDMIGRREGLGDLLAEGTERAAKKIGRGADQYSVKVKGQAYPMHEPRYKRGLALGYAVSPTGACHAFGLHDSGALTADEQGFQPNAELRAMGVVEPLVLESLGPEKVRAAVQRAIGSIARNCLTRCTFIPWTAEERMRILNAATGWDASAYEYYIAGRARDHPGSRVQRA